MVSSFIVHEWWKSTACLAHAALCFIEFGFHISSQEMKTLLRILLNKFQLQTQLAQPNKTHKKLHSQVSAQG